MKKIQVAISAFIVLFILILMVGTLVYLKSLKNSQSQKQETSLNLTSEKNSSHNYAKSSGNNKTIGSVTDKISLNIKEKNLSKGNVFLATKYFNITDTQNFSDLDKKRTLAIGSIPTDFEIINGNQCQLNSMSAECLVTIKNKKTDKLLYLTLGYHLDYNTSQVAIDAIVNNIPPFEYAQSNSKVGAMISSGKLLYTYDRSIIKDIRISKDYLSNKKIKDVHYNDKNKSIIISYINSSVITVIFENGSYKNFTLPFIYNGYSTYSVKPINNGHGYIVNYIKSGFNNRPSLLGLLLPNKDNYKFIYKKEFYTLPNLKQSKDGNLIYFLADGRNIDYKKAYVWSKSNGLKEIKYTSFNSVSEANGAIFMSVKDPDEKPNKLYKSSFGILIKASGAIKEYKNLKNIRSIKSTQTNDFIVTAVNDVYFVFKNGNNVKVANESNISSIDKDQKYNIFYLKDSKLFITYNNTYKLVDDPGKGIKNLKHEYVVEDKNGSVYFLLVDKLGDVFVYKLQDDFSFNQVAKFNVGAASNIYAKPLGDGLAVWSTANNPKNIYIYNNDKFIKQGLDSGVKSLRVLASLKDVYVIYPEGKKYFLELNKNTSKLSKVDLAKDIYNPLEKQGVKIKPNFASVIVNSTKDSFGMLFKDAESGENYKFIFWMNEKGKMAAYLLPDDADGFDTENSPLKSDTGQLFYVNTTDPSQGYNSNKNHFVLTVIGNDGNAHKYTATDGSMYINYEWVRTYFYTGENKSGVIVFAFYSNAQNYEYNSSFWISNTSSSNLTQLKAPEIFGKRPSSVIQIGGDYGSHQANIFKYKNTNFYVNINKDGSYYYAENRYTY